MMERDKYVTDLLPPRDETLDTVLRDALLDRKLHPMQVDENGARFLQLLVSLHKPLRVLEIGTYFGYSAIHMARALPEGGRLTTVECDPEIARIARMNFSLSKVDNLVDLVVTDAIELLRAQEESSLDMIFIDGAKESYPEYLKNCFNLLKVGGLLVADDCFPDGNFEKERGFDLDLPRKAINTYNRAVTSSPRLLTTFFGSQHGMAVSLKKS